MIFFQEVNWSIKRCKEFPEFVKKLKTNENIRYSQKLRCFTTGSGWQMWRVFRKQSDTCFMILAVALQSIDMNIKLIVQRIGGKIRLLKRIKI